MRCRDAKLLLDALRNGELARSESTTLQEHVKHCSACRAFEQYQQHLEKILMAHTARPPHSGISTERIMLAVQQQKRITEQLEDIHTQQQFRMARMRVVGPSLVAIIFFTLGSVPLLFLALAIVQPDLMVKTLAFGGDVIDTGIVLVQYLQSDLTLVTRNSWLLSGVALIFVVLMGMWLRLMRYPQEA